MPSPRASSSASAAPQVIQPRKPYSSLREVAEAQIPSPKQSSVFKAKMNQALTAKYGRKPGERRNSTEIKSALKTSYKRTGSVHDPVEFTGHRVHFLGYAAGKEVSEKQNRKNSFQSKQSGTGSLESIEAPKEHMSFRRKSMHKPSHKKVEGDEDYTTRLPYGGKRFHDNNFDMHGAYASVNKFNDAVQNDVFGRFFGGLGDSTLESQPKRQPKMSSFAAAAAAHTAQQAEQHDSRSGSGQSSNHRASLESTAASDLSEAHNPVAEINNLHQQVGGQMGHILGAAADIFDFQVTKEVYKSTGNRKF